MDKEIKHYKVGIDSETLGISLVSEPAIEEEFVALKKEQPKQIFMQSDEKHMVYGAVLVPDKDIYRVDERGNEFYLSFTKESIERMSQDFMKNYRQENISIQHEDFANEITVVESWIKTDMQYDKSVALGLNSQLPIGTWFVGMKCNNIDLWDKVKSHELTGFSVESLISLEQFNKKIENVMSMDNESFWTRMKNLLKEVFTSAKQEEEQNTIEPVHYEDMEAQEQPTQETVVETPTVETEQPVVEQTQQEEVVEQPTTEPTVVEQPTQETVVETPQQEEVKPNPQDELVKSLISEINSLKEQINELGTKPSTKPINTNASTSGNSDSYAQWRKQMSKYI